MRSSWLIRWARHPVTRVLRRGSRGDTDAQRGSDGSDEARSQGVRSHQKLEETKGSLCALRREHAL